MSEGTPRYHGKFRGTVVNNVDPEQRGRIQAIVPDVQGTVPITWALPCVPIAGKQEGIYVIPQVGAAVWIEFEQGDPDYPIWVGGFWGDAAEVPTAAFTPQPNPPGQSIVLQTTLQHSITISDATPVRSSAGTGGIILRSPTGAMIVVNDLGIYISNGKGASIELDGPNVMINKDGLVVK